jgi:hypothetical protein
MSVSGADGAGESAQAESKASDTSDDSANAYCCFMDWLRARECNEGVIGKAR